MQVLGVAVELTTVVFENNSAIGSSPWFEAQLESIVLFVDFAKKLVNLSFGDGETKSLLVETEQIGTPVVA